MLHQIARQFNCGLCDPADAVLGSTSGDGSVTNDTSGLNCATGSTGVWAEDDAVTSLQSQESLVENSGGWVGSWDDTSKDTKRLGIGGNAVDLILMDKVASLLMLVLVVHVLRTIVVLDNLVLSQSDGGIFNGHLGKRDTVVVGLIGGSEEDLIDLLLVQLQELKVSLVNLFHKAIELLDCLNWNL